MKLRSLIKIQQDFILANFVVDLSINLPNNKTSKPICWSKRLIFFDRNNILTFPLLLLCFRYCSVFKVQSQLLRSCWWAWEDSNLRPYAYQAYALTTWATSPWLLRLWSLVVSFRPNLVPLRGTIFSFAFFSFFIKKKRKWWRWGGSNSWPPACKAGALPAELHPRLKQGSEVIFLLSFSPFWRYIRRYLIPSKLNNDLLLFETWLT